MVLTNEIYDELQKGEIFKVVVTRVQRMHEPMKVKLKFVCVKIDWDWAIYCHHTDKSDEWIRDYGDKVHSEDIIQSICPCSPDVYRLYNH